MQQHIKIKLYLETVCSQIRCKKIHSEICEEIENHIDDQKEAFKAQGIEEETAIIKAIEQMGDPVIVGTELDRTHRPKPEWSIIALTFLLLFAGNFIRLFTSPYLESFYRQLIFTVVGTGLMVLCYYLDFTFIGKYSKSIFLLLVMLTILIIVISRPINGRYVNATYLLLLFPTAFAGIAYSMRSKGYWGIICCGFFIIMAFVISLIVPSITTSILLTLSCLLILTITIFKNWFGVKKLYAMLLVYLPVIAVPVLLIEFGGDYLHKRVELAFSPSLDPMGAGYIGNITRQLLSGAKFSGSGTIPESLSGMSRLPISPGISNDFLLTYTIHRLGWLAFIIVAVLLIIFIIRAFILCTKQKSILALLVSTAVTTTITMQTLFYVVANLGFQLFSPLSLPLISQSGSYLLINMCLVGILLSVFSTGHFIKDKGDSRKASTNSFMKFEDGKLIIDLKYIK